MAPRFACRLSREPRSVRGLRPPFLPGLTHQGLCWTLPTVPTSLRDAGIAATLGLVASGCQLIFGIDRLDYAEPIAEGCHVPREYDAGLRVGNLRAASDSIDLCVAKSGSSYQERALIERFGTTCPDVGYKQITVPLALTPGTYNIKAIATGANCSDTGLATAEDVVVSKGDVYTVLLMENEDEPPLLRAFLDAPPIQNTTQIRFIHAMAGYGSLDVGSLDGDELDPDIIFFDGAVFGELGPENSASTIAVENGYLQFGRTNFSFLLGVAESGETAPVASLPSNYDRNHAHTLYAIGRKDDNDYPPELFTCSDTVVEPDEVYGLFASCGDPRDVRVDVFNTNLTDLFTPYIDERRPALVEAIRKMDSDIVCLTEAYRDEDAAALVAAGLGNNHFTDATSSRLLVEQDQYDLSLEDHDGELPDYSAPACAEQDAELLGAYLECLSLPELGCVEEQDGMHVLGVHGDAATGCLASESCIEYAVGLLFGEVENQRCLMCGIAVLSGYGSIEDTLQRCTEPTPREARMAYEGALDLVVLSHYPIRDKQLRVLPATDWGRGILRAVIDLDNGESVDFYCSSISVLDDQAQLPYTGPYGNGEYHEAGLDAEQDLQIERIQEFVDETQDPRHRAILAGTLYVGPEVRGPEDDILVEPLRPDLYSRLTSTFTPLAAPSYLPECTACVDNPGGASFVGPILKGVWTSHLLGLGIRSHDVLSTERTFTTSTVAAEDHRGDPIRIPISQDYGLRSVIRISQ